MRIPRATYRLQFHKEFTFRDAIDVVPYLAELGVSDLYASPIFRARADSTHGYDVIDSNQLNPQLGSDNDFLQLTAACKEHGLGWLQDVVPNHMAFDAANKFLMDVFEKGPESAYFSHFDIDWNHPYAAMKGKVLAPFLGRHYGECLEAQELQLEYDGEILAFGYYGLKLPLRLSSYRAVTGFDKDELQMRYANEPEIRERVDSRIASMNGRKGDSDSFNELDEVHGKQHFRLAYWKVAGEEINYRRFFVVNDLISLRMEEAAVFNDTHALIRRLLREGHITGLRVDHIDGLYNPGRYLKNLRNEAPDNYIVVEKILERKEDLPSHWPVQGTTGYDFLNWVTQLFCESKSERQFEKVYSRFTDTDWNLHELAIQRKKQVIGEYMAGDVDSLAHLMKSISSRNRTGTDITLYALRRAIVEVLSRFPIYRTYINEEIFTDYDREQIGAVIADAKDKRPAATHELEFIRRALMFDFGYSLTDEEKLRWVHFIKRFQQVSSPVMAKGFEDTALYVYNRLFSLNEVGSDPSTFGIQTREFHKYLGKRNLQTPHAMNASSTHDTKRGEDARARLNTLSEFADEWRTCLDQWHRHNRGKKRAVRGMIVPDLNEEYGIYQSLLGHFPFDRNDIPQFVARFRVYLEKAAREAKVHTAWLEPRDDYENALLVFAEAVVNDSSFLSMFLPFQRKIAIAGVVNSLAQTLIKITAPGICDLYQGSELWNFSFVDPDNRQPVDFETRKRLLADIRMGDGNRSQLARDLLRSPENGAVKLFVILHSLGLRKAMPDTFEAGDYIPVRSTGVRRRNVFAFCRRKRNVWVMPVVPRLMSKFVQQDNPMALTQEWRGTTLKLPPRAPSEWVELFTNRHVKLEPSAPVARMLDQFPVALFVSK